MPTTNVMEELKMINESEYIRNNISFLVESFTKALEEGEIGLCHLVEGLQATLTHPNPTERALGTRFLVDVLQSLSFSKVSSDELKFLTTFFTDRLKDHHSVVPHVIIGFMALVKQVNISSENVISLIQAFFREVHCQSQVMADRRNIYSLLKFCVANKIEEVKQISTEFILGFITAMEGEKDPRNLVLLFSLIPHITKHLPLDNFAEDLFEVIAAYFPIDFIPPKSDPYGVVPEDLILGLRRSLSSTDAFAPYCIPLLQEKLDSDVISAKLDALLTLQECCEKYSPASLRPHILHLWGSLRREVIEGWNSEVESEAATTLGCLVSALEKGPSNESIRDGIIQLGSSAIMECVPHLSSPEQRLMFPSSRLLLATCSDSPTITQIVCKKVLPLLGDQYNFKKESIARKNTLVVLAQFLNQGAKFRVYKEAPFTEYKTSCFKALFQGLTSNDTSVKESAISSITLAVNALDEEQIRESSRVMIEILTENANQSLRTLIGNALVCLASASPSALLDEVLPSLLERVNTGQMEDREKAKQTLETIAALCTSVTPMKMALPVVWEEACRLLLAGNNICIQYLSCINKMVERSKGERASLEFLCWDWKGVLKCQLLTLNCVRSDAFSDPVPILEEISSICQGLIMGENCDFVEALVDVLLGERNCDSLPDVETAMNGVSLKDLSSVGESKQSSLIVYCLRGLIPDENYPVKLKNFGKIFNLVKKWSLCAEDERVRNCASLIFVSHILKIPSEVELESLLKPLEVEFCSKVYNSENLDLQSSSVRFLGWVVKGLIMRAYKEDLTWIRKLENLLLNPEFGQTASECYEFLLKDVPSFCSSTGTKPKTFRMLYKQRFFERRVEALVKQFQESEGKGKMNTLLAISHLLPCLPQAVLKGHLQKLLPVLAQGLVCTDPVVTSGAVQTLSSLLRHNVKDVALHVSTVTPSLLALSVTSPITVKVKALECLEALALLPPAIIMPLKQEVIHGLKSALDDRKRVVRRAAANARCAWVLV